MANGGGVYTLTLPSGAQYVYTAILGTADNGTQRKARLTKVVESDGTTLTLTYNSVVYCVVNNQDNCSQANQRTKVRLQSVRSSYGYQLLYSYAANQALTSNQGTNWDKLNSITAFNLAVDNCDVAASTCTFSQSWPMVSYSSGFAGYDTVQNVTAFGKTTRYTTTSGTGIPVTYKIKRPSSSVDNMTVTIDSLGRVTSVNNDGRVTSYAWSLTAPQLTAVITNPDSTTRTVISDTNVGLPVSVKDELNRITTYEYDTSGRLKKAIAPEGNYTEYVYNDATQRGNLTETRQVSKTPGTPANIVTTAGYPTSCANPKTCNQPDWTRDANGNQTDYTYDATHGGLATITLPAVPVNGSSVRPQTRYGYSALQAYYKDAGGSIVASGVTAYRLTSTSACRTTASCVNTADESRSTVSYGSQSPGVGNNLLPVFSTSGSGAAFQSGDAANLPTTAIGYDAIGNVISVDGPLAGADDTTRYRYNDARQLVGVVSADPDGAGGNPRLATRTSYNDDLQPTVVETGTVAGVTDSDWAAFTSAQQTTTTYDASARPIGQAVTSGGATYALTQYSYDARGRVQCVAQRMNPSAYGSLPASACSLGTAGSDGPDRIVKATYDAAGQQTKSTSAYGTADQSDDATATFTLNGLIATATDAENNRTTYSYDGFDRLAVMYMPSPAKGSGTSSGSDFEQLGYDVAGNVTSRRVRDGQVINYGYDALNRHTATDRPNSVYWETDYAYAYDLFGQITQASDSAGRVLGFAYDALGRQTSVSDNWYTFGNSSSQYDLAGRRSRYTWADGIFVSYGYDVVGRMTYVQDNAGNALTSFGYDNLGRRATLYRGNGVNTSYGYDGAGRLSVLTLTGGNQPNSIVLGSNPAGQITTRTISNDAYAWNGHLNTDRPYDGNGLNQYTSAGSVAFGYDGRGNVASSGSTSYVYTADNQLAVAQTTYGLGYDALGRLLAGVLDPGSDLRLTYDGSAVTAEIHPSNPAGLLRRYVYGPGTDEPLIWYEGPGLTDRRFLSADERGSIVSVTDNAGNAIRINTYDEHGIPATNNLGRFQYTGQKWLSSIGLYDYKARMYSPTLGRFMQTDPIGYADGMNWYNYVGSDPINKTDPSGLADVIIPPPNRQNGFDVPQSATVIVTGQRAYTMKDLNNVLRQQAVRDLQRGPASASSERAAPSDCAARAPSGQCAYVRDDDGKLKLDPEYAKKACQNYKSMMTANRNVGLGNLALSVPGTANAGLGGTVGWLSKTAGVLGGRFMTFERGVTALTTGLLGAGGAYSAPEGCK